MRVFKKDDLLLGPREMPVLKFNVWGLESKVLWRNG